MGEVGEEGEVGEFLVGGRVCEFIFLYLCRVLIFLRYGEE